MTSCNDEFLDLAPKGAITDATACKSFQSCTDYELSFYDVFNGYTLFQGPSPVSDAFGTSTRDLYSSILTNYGSGWNTISNGYADQRITVPVTSSAYSNPYYWIRMCNIMLSHIEEPNVSDEQRTYLEAVARFFRAYCHYALLVNYGDCIYSETVLTEKSEELFKARDSRLFVADRIYNELKWCAENIPDGVAEANTINSTVCKAMLSRFCLFEGTWRKYHNVAEDGSYVKGTELLQACAKYSKEVMDLGIALYKGDGNDEHAGQGWGQMWTTDDLGNVPSVFLYNKYVADIKMHRLGHFEHIASAALEMPQSTVDLYLTKDGLPIHNAGVKYYDYTPEGYVPAAKPYDYANCDPYLTFRNRDTRLAQMVIPPYHVTLRTVAEGASDNSNCWTPDESANGKYSEYIHQFAFRGTQGKLKDGTTYWCSPNFNLAYNQIPTHKSLPSTNWAGNVLVNEPHTQSAASENWSTGMTQYGVGKGFQKGHSGYFVWKHVANWDRQYASGTADVSDKPVFKLEEVLLNYAEAMFELGQFNQGVADQTINLLRDRAEVGRMNVSAIDESFDPDRDKTVDPVLWEIRRERLIELMGESFSFEDVRRWKKAPWFVNKQAYGVWVDAENMKSVKSFTGGATGLLDNATGLEADAATVAAQGGGHLYYYLDPVKAGKGWIDEYYLSYLPSEELLLNDKLTQNHYK
jgi:SusD family.